MNILDYVDFRGDILFSERGLNEVDNLIFSELSYLEMGELFEVCTEGSDADCGTEDAVFSGRSFTISELKDEYGRIREGIEYAFSDPWPLLVKCAESARFRDVTVKWFVNDVNPLEQAQFAAVSFFYGLNDMFVALRGTDGNFAGWREGFSFSFLDETAGQRQAVEYLNKTACGAPDCSIVVGGHSKGGNFAEYAAAFAKDEVRSRVTCVYSDDGPGFPRTVTETEEYKAVLSKTVKIMPEASFIGRMLYGDEEIKTVKGEVKGLLQHDPFNWSVRGTEFEPADPAKSALLAQETLNSWIEGMDEEERKEFTETVFSTIEGSGMNTLADLHKKRLRSLIGLGKAYRRMDKEKHEMVRGALKAIRSEAGRTIRSKRNNK